MNTKQYISLLVAERQNLMDQIRNGFASDGIFDRIIEINETIKGLRVVIE